MPRGFLVSSIAALLMVSAHAQIATTTSLVGTVTDSSGKSVPGAKVTAVNKNTLDTYTATTNDRGFYRFEFVRVGTYNLIVEQAGFQRFEKTGIGVDINSVVRNDVTLTVGSLSQSVTIGATAPVIKTGDATVKGVFANWHLNGIVTIQSGMPFNVTYGTDTANTSSGGSTRPNLVGTPSSDCGHGHLTGCISASAFAIPALYNYGNAGRNLLHGPHLHTTDASLFKNFPIRERLELQIGAKLSF